MKENKLFALIKSYHSENFKWYDFFIIQLLLADALLEVGQSVIGFPIAASILRPFLNESNVDFLEFAVLYLQFIGIWIIVLLFCLIKYNRPIYKVILKGVKGNTLKNMLIGLLIGFVTNALCILVAVLHKDIHIYFDEISPIHLILLFIIIFIQSSAEELVCRGFLYQHLAKGYKNPAFAIILNAVFFGLIHLGNPGVSNLAILNIILVGISYSLFVYFCDSLWLPMAAHCAWNFTQNIIFGLPNSGLVSKYSIFKLDAATATNSFAYNTAFGVESTILACIVLAICIILTIIWGKKGNRKPTNIWSN